MPKPKISVIIPSFRRSGLLYKATQSIHRGTFRSFEIITATEKGPLVTIKNKAIKKAKGEIIVFTDDDCIASPYWLEQIWKTFQDNPECSGVTGPTWVDPKIRNNRDLLKFHEGKGLLKSLYHMVILENKPWEFAKLYRSGATSIGSNYQYYSLQEPHYQKADYLEACNFAFRRDIVARMGAFDEIYGGCGDYAETDFSLQIKRFEGNLIFNPRAIVYHNINDNRTTISDAYTRMHNYMVFRKRWIPWNWRAVCNVLFLNGYWVYKAIETRQPSWLGGVKATCKCLMGI